MGSVPASDHADLLALSATARTIVDPDRFAGLSASDTRRVVYGTERRTILTHSPQLHEHQARGFTGTTAAKAGRQLDELAATLARGATRRTRSQVEAGITKITRDSWVGRVITWQLSGSKPPDLRLSWSINQNAQTALEDEIFGKHARQAKTPITQLDHRKLKLARRRAAARCRCGSAARSWSGS